ncbi:MAG: hypothetical protein RI940_501 [Bacteroidota bacterium]
MSSNCKFLLLIFTFCFFHHNVSAQNYGQGMGRMSSVNNSNQGNSKIDSLKRRDKNADSITIYYKLYNSNEIQKLDSSINDFFKHYPMPYSSYHLGNLGTASKSYIFNSIKEAGWDDGFHAFDVYDFTLQKTPYYQTTRPYTEFGYLLGGKGEQMVDIKHTQNKTQQFNFSFDYRFTNAPGNVKNQKANSNQMRITTHFQSKRKRYESFLTLLLNKSASSENGGLINAALLDSLSLNNPYELDTRLGISGASFRNPFNTYIATGTTYQKNTVNWKQSYDFGQKDSIVKDTIVTHLFYPRLRLQNELKVQSSQYVFSDDNPNIDNYLKYFGVVLDSAIPFNFTDNWKYINDEFSIISYPEKMNSNQYLQIGAGYDLFYASFPNKSSWNNYNIYGFAVYKNKTRNQLWDLLASGKLFLNGYHAGDYNAKASLYRMLSSKGTYLQLSFQNLNRTPSSNMMGITQFPINGFASIKKENSTLFNGVIGNEKSGWTGSASYQVIQNYQYFSTGFKPVVYGNLMNYLSAQLEHKVKISKHWSWYDQVTLQALDPNAPVHVPFLLTRQRLAFEGNFYKNLNLSTGLELIYHTNYKADAYMPFTGQFYLQDSYTTQNRPIANAYLNFMIKRFKGYIRLENLNTLLPTSKQYGNAYNFTAQHYPSAGLWFRVGIWWNFIN